LKGEVGRFLPDDYLSRNESRMKITDDELLSIIEDVTLTLGQILLNHRELSESLLDTQQTERGKEKMDSLRQRIAGEKEKLSRIRQTQQRKKELERLRKDHEKESKVTETKQKLGTVALRNQRGQLVGWLQTVGKNRVNILDAKGRVVAREIDGRTFDGMSQFQGYGNQGLRVLGMKMKG
jgi:hypothetical protein